VSNVCLNCGSKTSNPKFCSRSCSATYTNKAYPKRKRTSSRWSKCIICGNEAPWRRKYCNQCRRKHDPNYRDWMALTIKDLQDIRSYQVNSRIRELARGIYKQSDKPKKCIVCGYHLHYEVCHIMPINELNPDTPISVVNDLSNLIALCPNHHWELDNGHLTLDDFKHLL